MRIVRGNRVRNLKHRNNSLPNKTEIKRRNLKVNYKNYKESSIIRNQITYKDSLKADRILNKSKLNMDMINLIDRIVNAKILDNVWAIF